MKSLTNFLNEQNNDIIYGVYMDDGTNYNYFEDEQEANECCDKLNKENPDAKAKVKKEKKSSIVSEGMSPNALWDKYEKMKDLVSVEEILDEVCHILSSDVLEDTLRTVDRNFELNVF